MKQDMPSSLTLNKNFVVAIEVTRKCNLACPHCFTDSNDQCHPGPDVSQLEDLLAQTARLGVRGVAICGGEPLLRPDLEGLMHFGLARGIANYSLVTNGILLTADRAAALRDAGLRQVQVSLDGVTAEDYDLVRNTGPAAYYKAIRAIRHFQNVGIDVSLACLLSPHNMERCPEMVLLCEALHITQLRYCAFVPAGRGQHDIWRERYRLEPEKLKRFSDFMKAVEGREDIPVEISVDHGAGPCGSREGIQCSAGQRAYISSDGEVYACTGLIHPEFSLGNVNRQSLEEVLQNPKRCAWTFPKNELQGPCRTCSNTACSGGCRGAAFSHTGDLKGAVLNCVWNAK